jgi:ArsR family transcriptional regulator
MLVNIWSEEMPRQKLATIDGPVCCAPLMAAPLSEDEATGLARGFAALADPARLRLLSMLASADAGEVCACDLVEPLGRSQPTVSHHLKVLAESGLVVGEKRGRWVWYSIVPEHVAALCEALAVEVRARS